MIDKIKQLFPDFSDALINQLIEKADFAEVPAQSPLIKFGQYVKQVPLVIEGVIKVLRKEPDRDFLLYYIEPGQSCIMSYAAIRQETPSLIEAIAETPAELLLLNRDSILELNQHEPAFSQYFLSLYHRTYGDLLSTIDLMIFGQMDKRLMTYLQRKADLTESNQLSLTHSAIAQDLGTAREVISRMLKKLEKEGSVQLGSGTITLLG